MNFYSILSKIFPKVRRPGPASDELPKPIDALLDFAGPGICTKYIVSVNFI